MFVQVHPAVNLLRGDESYRPSITKSITVAGGREMIEGVFLDDGPRGGSPPRPDVPFKIVLPDGFGTWHALNMKIYAALKKRSRFILIDEADS